jgi:hypothetical protein
MGLEETIMDLTSQTPSGGICWIGELPFTVWFGSDYWEWEFQGVYYFDPLDLSEAIEAFLQRTADDARQADSLSEYSKAQPRQVSRKFRRWSPKGTTELVSGYRRDGLPSNGGH